MYKKNSYSNGAGGYSMQKHPKYNSKNQPVLSPILLDDRKKFYIGTIYKNKNNEYAKVIDYNGAFDVKIQFLNTGCIKSVRLDHLSEGNFADNTLYVGKHFYSPGINSEYIVKEVGEYRSIVEFLDPSHYIMEADNSLIIQRRLHNPFYRNNYGGYFGIGDQIYDERLIGIWRLMLERTRNPFKDYSSLPELYGDCFVDEDWLNFQNFSKWYNSELEKLNKNVIFKYNIDKDFKQISKHPKIYSPSTCMLIPAPLNNTISGIYNNQNGLPIGVIYMKKSKNVIYHDKYKYIYINEQGRKVYCKGFYTDPMEAFEIFRQKRLLYIKEKAKYFYSINAISLENFEIIKNIDLLPFGN